MLFRSFARQCPQNNKVKSDRKGKPPGLTSYHMGLGSSSVPTEQLRELAASTESTGGLAVLSITPEWNRVVDASWDGLDYYRGLFLDDEPLDEDVNPFETDSDVPETDLDVLENYSKASVPPYEDLDGSLPPYSDGWDSDLSEELLELPRTAAEGLPRTRLGDLYAQRAEELLDRQIGRAHV